MPNSLQVVKKRAELDKIKIDETKQQVVKNDTRIKGKQELGDAYGMKDASSIGKNGMNKLMPLLLLLKVKIATLGTELI